MSRVAVITGAAGGIGRACVVAFMEAGWDVAGIDRADRPEGLPGKWYEQMDISVRSAGDRLRAFFAQLGQIDTLVNNAAVRIQASERDDRRRVGRGHGHECGGAVRRRARGHPLPAGQRRLDRERGVRPRHCHLANVATYAASKGALMAFTRAAALELGPMGVRVNAVLPGAVDTPMLHASGKVRIGAVIGEADELTVRTPLRRIGRPEEIASVIVFLADGERSSFVTGQGWVVDGGATARLGTE